MIAIVEVGLATARPPREHRTVQVIVSVEVIDLNILLAELDAVRCAIDIAMCADDAVMPVRSQIVEIKEI